MEEWPPCYLQIVDFFFPLPLLLPNTWPMTHMQPGAAAQAGRERGGEEEEEAANAERTTLITPSMDTAVCYTVCTCVCVRVCVCVNI